MTAHTDIAPQVDRPLAGRVAVVTGATGGIGQATATRLAAAGARVAVLGRRADRLAEVARETGALAVPADVTRPEDLQRAASAVHAELGRVDLVVANAGVMLAAPYETASTDEWQRMVDTNLTGLLHTGRAFVEDLLTTAATGRPADLVHVGSIGSHIVFPGYAVYAATKAAVAQLTRTLRAELGPSGVRVRAIEPGLTDSDLGVDMADPASREAFARMRRDVTAIPAADVADVIAWSAAVPARVNLAELVVVPTGQG